MSQINNAVLKLQVVIMSYRYKMTTAVLTDLHGDRQICLHNLAQYMYFE